MTPESQLIQRAQDLILENPEISIRKLAAVLEESYSNIRRIIKKDLQYTSYVLKIRQMLSESDKLKRLSRCNLLLCSLKHEAAGRTCGA